MYMARSGENLAEPLIHSVGNFSILGAMMNEDRQPLLKHCHIIKLGRLLNMLYRPSEIAEELGVNVDTVYRGYLPAGLPHTRDDKGNIWIHGTTCAQWARQTVSQKKAKRRGLPDGSAWCVVCNRPVEMIEPLTVKPINFYLEILQGKCPRCGRTVNRARARKGDGRVATEGSVSRP